MARMSRNKGKRGEREVANILRDLGFDTRRGVQFQGGPDSPDVVGISGVHLEVKYQERESVRAWMDQAEQDASDNVPAVVHRKNGTRWLLTIRLEDIHEFVMAVQDAQKVSPLGPADLPG